MVERLCFWDKALVVFKFFNGLLQQVFPVCTEENHARLSTSLGSLYSHNLLLTLPDSVSSCYVMIQGCILLSDDNLGSFFLGADIYQRSVQSFFLFFSLFSLLFDKFYRSEGR